MITVIDFEKWGPTVVAALRDARETFINHRANDETADAMADFIRQRMIDAGFEVRVTFEWFEPPLSDVMRVLEECGYVCINAEPRELRFTIIPLGEIAKVTLRHRVEI